MSKLLRVLSGKSLVLPLVWAAILMPFSAEAQAPASKSATRQFSFRDVAEEAGLFPHVGGIRGHAAAWGDVDGNGWPDLFVGTFHAAGSRTNVLLRNKEGHFALDEQRHVQTSGLGSGALFVDLTNDGRLDLYVSNCAHGKEGPQAAASLLFRNDGEGKFTDVSAESGACPAGYEGRGLTTLDFDGDGLLDLLTCEQYYSPQVKTGPALYRNLGKLKFKNVAEEVGLPPGLGGLGVAAGDVNNDGWPDVFLSSGAGDHRLYLNDGHGRFNEAAGSRAVFRWKHARPEDTPAGVCMADVNRDGLADIVMGQHFKRPWVTPVGIRLYLNRGVTGGVPTFEDVTEASGLAPLMMKAPHVEIQDFDNDGWPDIYTSIVKFDGTIPCPLIYKNLGEKNSVPQFREDAWAVNDFPTAEDRAAKGSGPFFEKLLRDKKIIYMAAAPSCDFDRDGKIDLFLANWWLESPSLLLRNETPSRNWLDVQVEGSEGVNRMGIGSKINVYQAGKRGKRDALIGSREIQAGYGFCSGQAAVAHFGLGDVEQVDLQVTLPHGKGTIDKQNVKANQRLVISRP